MAFNKMQSSRIEKNATSTSDIIYNQHLTLECNDLKKQDLEQGSFKISLVEQNMFSTPLVAEFKMDLLNVYYANSKHCMEDKWIAMINMSETGTKIRAIMKMSCQLIGPSDQQNQLKFNPSDIKDPTVKLMLPPSLNSKV